MHQVDLPYTPDSSALFASLKHLPAPVFLDSGHPTGRKGRFDILAAAPVATVVCDGDGNRLETGEGVSALPGSPFQALKDALSRFAPTSKPETELPFCGGAIGYFAYDLGRQIEALPTRADRDIPLPEMRVGIYQWALIVDHQLELSYLIWHDGVAPELIDQIQQLTTKPSHAASCSATSKSAFRLQGPFQSNMDAAGYRRRFERVKEYILAGDCYQVNLAQRFSAPYSGDCWNAYLALRERAPTPFSAYLETPEGTIMSLSPERFLRTRGIHVETKPIKGTRPRGHTQTEDHRLKKELLSSTKDRAENLMIVDLLRNDLGKTCCTGSVHVPQLFAIESYANVHHLVTTVCGQLSDPKRSLELLEGCFPGGSITGAPKLRAMEIIEELEPQRRSLYCGSIGYIDFNGNMDTSICIRTLIASEGQIHCWGGGGLVADSQWDAEYAETFTKIGNLTATLEAEFAQQPRPRPLTAPE